MLGQRDSGALLRHADGTALLNTVAATTTASYLTSHTKALELAAVHGYRDAFLLGVGAVASAVLVRSGRL